MSIKEQKADKFLSKRSTNGVKDIPATLRRGLRMNNTQRRFALTISTVLVLALIFIILFASGQANNTVVANEKAQILQEVIGAERIEMGKKTIEMTQEHGTKYIDGKRVVMLQKIGQQKAGNAKTYWLTACTEAEAAEYETGLGKDKKRIQLDSRGDLGLYITLAKDTEVEKCLKAYDKAFFFQLSNKNGAANLEGIPAEYRETMSEMMNELEFVNFGYNDDYWFSDDSCWQGGSNMEYDDNSGCYRSRSVNNNHWDYADQIEQTGESPYIKFLKAPVIDDDGIYSFTLTPKSVDRTASVSAYVYQVIDNDALLLGETTEINCDWDKGQFEDGFDGYWLSLPDGQNLSISVVAITDEYTVYSSPILLNGEETNLRFKLYTEDYSIVVEGAWDGIDDSGAAAKSVKQINSGDKIVPLYTSVSLVDDSDEETLWEGAEYVVSGSLELTYALLEEADYLYAFCIDDIYNDFYLTDFVEFAVDANGDTYFYIYE